MGLLSLSFLADALVKASFVLAVTAVLALSLRRSSASARHLVWTLGMIGALAAPALSLVTPRWTVPIVRLTSTAQMPAAASIDASSNPVERRAPAFGRAAEDLPRATRTDRASAAPGFSRRISWTTLLLVTWAIGAALIVARVLLGLVAVSWMSRRTATVTDAAWLEEARSLARSLGLQRVRFLRARTGSMPMAWGVFRSSVLMPGDAETWPAERLRVVLLHELAHVKRHDCLTHLVAQIACAAYWFNPLAWMAARRLRAEREHACDDLVLSAGTRNSDYADQLLDIARVMRAGRFPAVLAGATLAMAHRSQLEGRLIAILDPSVPRRRLSRARAVLATAMFGALIVPVAAVQPWAEEPAAIKAAMAPGRAVPPADVPQPTVTQEKQNTVQPAPSGRLERGIAGGIEGGVQGGVEGGVARGVTGGVVEGVSRGVSGGVAAIGERIGVAVGPSAAASVAGSVTDSVASSLVGAAHEVAVEKIPGQSRDKDQRAVDPRTINALMEALKDSDKEVRETAMAALVRFRDPRIFDPLLAALRDASPDVREKAAFGLGQLRDARAIQPLAAAVKDENADVREQAVFALGQLRAAAAIDAILPALHDASDAVREQAAFALGQIRDSKAVEPLISALKDGKENVREQAAFALGQIRDSKAVEALVIALKDASKDVREQAAFALGQLRDPRAIDGLTAALKDANASVRQQAAFALGQIR